MILRARLISDFDGAFVAITFSFFYQIIFFGNSFRHVFSFCLICNWWCHYHQISAAIDGEPVIYKI